METHVGYQLRRASAYMMADLGARLEPSGLRPTEAAILLVIHANQGCQQGAVGDLLGIKPANMVPIIARLVKQGLVSRARADGRSHALSLTETGRTLAARVTDLLDNHEAAIQSRLDRGSLDGLLGSLTLLRG